MLAEAVKLAADADLAILAIGMNNDWAREGVDRKSLRLPCRTNELISAVCTANPQTVVVCQSACAVSMIEWRDVPATIIQAWYQGQENGNAIADVLLSHANPSGKLPITFPEKIEDHGSAKYFPGDVGNYHVEYTEGVFSGYRWFYKTDTRPMWEFGYWLSYTTFDISDIMIVGAISLSSSAMVTTQVKNTGTVFGSEVVQGYVSSSPVIAATRLSSVPKALKGFEEVDLQPGEKKEVCIRLNNQAVQWYDITIPGWKVGPGNYTAWVGVRSRDIKGELVLFVI
jgi:beta-glucosidase